MNFFAHFEVARALGAPSSAWLGAMLPDLLPMCSAKLAEPADPGVAEGVALHHRTDAVFHVCDLFVREASAARRTLGERGLRRGPALAVAHVGVELQLDGWLARQRGSDSFVETLRAPGDIWHDAASRTRFAQMAERLVRVGVPHSYAAPDSCARGLQRMLASRPRLALRDGEVLRVQEWLEDAAAAVPSWADALMQDVVGQLAAATDA